MFGVWFIDVYCDYGYAWWGIWICITAKGAGSNLKVEGQLRAGRKCFGVPLHFSVVLPHLRGHYKNRVGTKISNFMEIRWNNACWLIEESAVHCNGRRSKNRNKIWQRHDRTVETGTQTYLQSRQHTPAKWLWTALIMSPLAVHHTTRTCKNATYHKVFFGIMYVRKAHH